MSTEVKRVPLTGDQLDIVNYCEEYWLRRKTFPTLGELERTFPDEDMPALMVNGTFIFAMHARGVVMHVELKGKPSQFTASQIAAATKFLDVHDRRTLQTKLKEVGCTTTQWNAWMRDKQFKEFVLQSASDSFEDTIAEAQNGLRTAIANGETQAIKFYYELTGRYNSGEGNTQNLKLVVAQIIESIQRRVKDPEVLADLSNDFDAIINGRRLAQAVIEPEYNRLL